MKNKKYHFIGISGVSMSGLASLMLEMGFLISGCDLKQISNNSQLLKSKIKVWKGHDQKHITKDLDGIVVTAAALHPNSLAKTEIEKAKELNIPIIKRSEMIGKLMSDPKTTGIAVSGMHGKTTTSTMIALILEEAGYKPTALIGSDVKEWGTNYKKGLNKYFVVEACEYEKQLLDFKPKIEVILNLEKEHLDTYTGGMKDIKQTFNKFIKKLPSEGMLIIWREDSNLMQLASKAKKRGIKVKEVSVRKIWPGLKLKIPGKHILLDATFAARTCHELGVSSKTIKKVLNNFTGAVRRFEVKGKKNGITVIDDYGHHPTEIQKTIEATRDWMNHYNNNNQLAKNKLIVVFQPHQYERTKLLFNDFTKSFKSVDVLIITDIYLIAGREPKEAKADFSKQLVNAIYKTGIDAKYAVNFQNVLLKLNKIAKSGDIILTLGATDIYKVGEEFLK